MSKVRLAVYGAAGCGGCELSLLENPEVFMTLFSHVEVAFWPLITDSRLDDLTGLPDNSIELGVLCGGVRTELDYRVASLLAAKCRSLVAVGSCALWGGIAALADLPSAGCLQLQAQPPLPPLLPRLFPLTKLIKEVYPVPGCPPKPDQLGTSLLALTGGQEVQADFKQLEPAVCSSCPRPRGEEGPRRWYRYQEITVNDRCFLTLGLICSGPATRGGCGARCPKVGLPCRGCYGPPAEVNDQGARLIGALAALEVDEIYQDASLLDAVGTLYRYTWAATFAQ